MQQIPTLPGVVCCMRVQDIFKADDTNFSMNPVESYEEIAAACVSIRDTTVRSCSSICLRLSTPHAAHARHAHPSPPSLLMPHQPLALICTYRSSAQFS